MTMKLLYLPVVLAMMAGCTNAEKRINEKQENPAQQAVVAEGVQQTVVSEDAPTVYFTNPSWHPYSGICCPDWSWLTGIQTCQH